MANITESWPLGRVTLAAPKISTRMWARLVAGSFGALFCAVGASIAVLPFPALSGGLLVAKFAMGVVVFLAGFIIARSGGRPPARELHYDPKFGEFILVPSDEGWDAAQCVMSTEVAHVEVSGRHLSVASEDTRLQISIAMKDAATAREVSSSCQSQRRAA